jgi:hypothetical protein
MRNFLVLSFLVLNTSARAASPCTASRLLVVLDHSSSMNDLIGGNSKWSIAVGAVNGIASRYQSSLEIGLHVFPNPHQCSVGDTLVAPALGNAAAIAAALPSGPPDTGNYTPMAQAIDAAAADPSLTDPARHPSLLLITDGWQWCSPYDAATRTWPVDAVERAAKAGISVFVVGFGGDVDARTLNQMAVAAGTAPGGCDPNATDARCYFQADSTADLDAALDTISATVSAEVCDGVDNNCDGRIDENLTRPCSSGCGGGIETCVAGVWTGCTARAPAAEVCDGIDNDCDGIADNGATCAEGFCEAGSCRTAHIEPSSPDGGATGESAAPNDGCGCRIGGRSSHDGWLAILTIAVGLILLRRRAAIG